MSTPFYVSPQQAMADRAEYARKGIARGRSLVVLQYADGIVFVGENPSRALHKFSEIYDRIGFAAAGKYNEYENLRIGGVRYADLRGYTYDRDDVTARGLANVYAQTLGTIFSSAAEKPYEVELVVAEVGALPEGDQIYRLPHDGSIVDEHGSVAVGGNAEQISSFLDQRHRDGMTLAEALKLAVQALSREPNGGEREIPAERLEVAVLDRTRPQQRKFKRIVGRQLKRLLDADAGAPTDAPSDDEGTDATDSTDSTDTATGTTGTKDSGGTTEPPPRTSPLGIRAPYRRDRRYGARSCAGPGGGCGGAAHHQVHGQAARLRRPAVQDGEEGRHAPLAHLLGGQPYGGELRFHGRRQGEIVEAGHGDVVGHPQPASADRLAGAGRQDVVVADDGRRPGRGVRQGAFRGFPSGRDVQRGGDGAYDRVGHAAQGVVQRPGADREGPGVHGRGEVHEPAVTEAQQMFRHLAHAVRDIEVHMRCRTPVGRVAVQHHERQSGPAQGSHGLGGHGRGDHTVERRAGRGEGVPGRTGAVG